MANQVRMRTNDLERLLDLDDSAILCFAGNQEVAYCNRGAANLFGYTSDETSDLDMQDMFADDIASSKATQSFARWTCWVNAALPSC